MVVGGHHVLRAGSRVGTFAAFNVYLTYLIWPMIALGWVTNLVQRGLASLGRLMTIFESKPDIDDRAVPARPAHLAARGNRVSQPHLSVTTARRY